jgi:hypothetical protein
MQRDLATSGQKNRKKYLGGKASVVSSDNHEVKRGEGIHFRKWPLKKPYVVSTSCLLSGKTLTKMYRT